MPLARSPGPLELEEGIRNSGKAATSVLLLVGGGAYIGIGGAWTGCWSGGIAIGTVDGGTGTQRKPGGVVYPGGGGTAATSMYPGGGGA